MNYKTGVTCVSHGHKLHIVVNLHDTQTDLYVFPNSADLVFCSRVPLQCSSALLKYLSSVCVCYFAYVL